MDSQIVPLGVLFRYPFFLSVEESSKRGNSFYFSVGQSGGGPEFI